MVVQRT